MIGVQCLKLFVVIYFYSLGAVSPLDDASEQVVPSNQDVYYTKDLNLCSNCVTEYKGLCQDTSQCKWLGEHAECMNGQCICANNYRWFKGACVKSSNLNEKCETNEECFDGLTWGSLKCYKNKCVCNDGYRNREDVDCRKISVENGTCAINFDCPPDHACLIGKCVKNNTSSLQIASLNSASVMKNIDDDKLNLNYSDGVTCNEDADCGIENMECYELTKTCACKHGYFLLDNKCEAELGVKTCEKDLDCYTLEAQCSGDHICECRDYWFIQSDNRKCIKTMLQTNKNCLSNEWCYAMGNNSLCSTEGKCECRSSAKLNETDFLCQKKGDDDKCISDEECNHIKPNSVCKNEGCICPQNFKDLGEKCVAALNGTCTTSDDCSYTEHSECKEKLCACQDNFVPNSIWNSCLKVAPKGGDCDEDIQCTTSHNRTRCAQNKCSCQDIYEDINNECEIVKKYGEYCTNSRQCRLFDKNLECRNSECQCHIGEKYIDYQCTSAAIMSRPATIMILISMIIKMETLLVF